MSITHTNIDIRETHTVGSRSREWLVSAALCPALIPHDINLVGRTEADADFCFIRLDPPGSQLLACTGGAGWVWIDSVWEQCEAGQVYVTPPGVFHAYRSDNANPWSLCWVQSPCDWLGVGEKPLLLSAETGPLAESISGLHRELIHSAEPSLLPPWAFLVSSYARRLVRPSSGDPRLRLLWESVNTDLAGPWTVDALAGQVGVSPEHLRRLCHSHLAVSPMRHVTTLRMRRAAAYLASESYTVEAVARLVGYDSPYAFSTAFKRHMGMPPSEYRQGKPRTFRNQ